MLDRLQCACARDMKSSDWIVIQPHAAFDDQDGVRNKVVPTRDATGVCTLPVVCTV